MEIGYTLMTEQSGPTDLVHYAVAAEQAGLAFEACSDHYFPWLDAQGHAPNAWTVLGAVAQATERVELMTYVTCPIMRYHPAVVAQQAATLGLPSAAGRDCPGARAVPLVGRSTGSCPPPQGSPQISRDRRTCRPAAQCGTDPAEISPVRAHQRGVVMVQAPDVLSMLDSHERALLRPGEPGFVSPMLATLTETYFSDPNWLYERKLDGVRAVVVCGKDGTRLYSRNRKIVTSTYPELVEGLDERAPAGLVADGEIVAFEGEQTSFSRLQTRLGLSDPRRARSTGVAVYLYRADAAYRPGQRSHDWLKFKCVREQEFVIGGYTDPAGARTGLGAVLVGYYDQHGLRYAGKVGTGFDERTLRSLRERFDALGRPDSPFADPVPPRGVHWLRPELVAQIGFTEWTREGRLRHPRYLGLRHDKPAIQVVREETTRLDQRD